MRWAPLLTTLSLLACVGAAAQTPSVEMLVAVNPGVFESRPDGQVTGSGAALMARLSTLSGVPIRLRALPVARALMTLSLGPTRCMVGMPRTPEREARYRWAGQMASGGLVLYGRADEVREVQSPADLRGAVVAAQRESQPLAWLRQHDVNVYEVNDTLTGLRMLRAGRVDYWLVNDVVGQRAIQQAGAPQPRALRSFGRIDVYIACHLDFPEAIAERLRAGLEQMRREGDLAEFGLR